jgi:hypothetical protein
MNWFLLFQRYNTNLSLCDDDDDDDDDDDRLSHPKTPMDTCPAE